MIDTKMECHVGFDNPSTMGNQKISIAKLKGKFFSITT
jgi:hypothetical protein